ncbi:MAG: PQQ-binding-like beta-propeller repeat protein [Thermoguttaceae bacterium]|jgi:outer membrane protein assembly factor BamB
MTVCRFLPICVPACLLVCIHSVRAADWPQWGGRDDRNMVSTEQGLPDTFVPGKKSPRGTGIDLASTRNVKWVARLGTQSYGNVTVSQGRVLIGTNDEALHDPRYRPTRGGLVLCLDEATGKLLWQLIVPRFLTNLSELNFDNMGLGVCSSPTIEGNRVYLVTNRCEVLCLDLEGLANGNDGPFQAEGQFIAGPGNRPVALEPTDADIIWRRDMIGELGIWPQDAANCSVLIHGDVVYVCTSNGVDRSHVRVPRPLAPSLIALDKKTGRFLAGDDEKIGTRLFHGQWSSPSLGQVHGKAIVFFGGGDGVMYAFEALENLPQEPVKLQKVWSFDCNPPNYRFVRGKKVEYYSGDVRKHRDNNNDGTFTGPSEIIATPVFYKDRVYVAIGQDPSHGRGRGMLSCIDATKSGDITASGKIWSYGKIGRSLSTVAIADGLLYVADTFEGLHCLDAETGQLYWFHPANSEVWGSPLVADGKIYLGTRRGLLVMAAGKEKKVLSEITLGAPCLSTPVAANGVLYVASHQYLWAVKKQ